MKAITRDRFGSTDVLAADVSAVRLRPSAPPLVMHQHESEGATSDMNITIFGGTGQVGRRLVDEATTRGHQVTAVTRSGPPSDGLDSVTWIAGDARNRQDVRRLSLGRDIVISATSGPRAGGDELAITARALLDGIADTDARLIVVGGAGPLIVPSSGGRLVVDDPHFVPASIRGVAQACVDQLDALRQDSTVAWTYFSPSAQMTAGQRTGRFTTGTDELIVDGDGTSRISLEDVAVAVLDEAEQPRHVRAVLTAGLLAAGAELRGGRALEPRSSPGDDMTIRCENDPMLLDGIHHVAILSSDTDRLVDFYQSVFGAAVEHTSVDGARSPHLPEHRTPHGTEHLRDRREPRGRPPDADVRSRTARPHRPTSFVGGDVQ